MICSNISNIVTVFLHNQNYLLCNKIIMDKILPWWSYIPAFLLIKSLLADPENSCIFFVQTMMISKVVDFWNFLFSLQNYSKKIIQCQVVQYWRTSFCEEHNAQVSSCKWRGQWRVIHEIAKLTWNSIIIIYNHSIIQHMPIIFALVWNIKIKIGIFFIFNLHCVLSQKMAILN